jgi:hypothetical protein
MKTVLWKWARLVLDKSSGSCAESFNLADFFPETRYPHINHESEQANLFYNRNCTAPFLFLGFTGLLQLVYKGSHLSSKMPLKPRRLL